jgi:hypothetical protein
MSLELFKELKLTLRSGLTVSDLAIIARLRKASNDKV